MEIPMAGSPATAAAPSSPLSAEMKAELDALVAEHELVLFMKGTPDAPQCGFSNRAAGALTELGRPFHAVNVFEMSPDPWATVQALAAWAEFPTLPMIWVKGELIGGSDIAVEMLESGELAQMLA
jgi:monothiol glutaredoxin